MFDTKKFVTENQITSESKLTGEVVKRVWNSSYERYLIFIFESNKFAIFCAHSWGDGCAEIELSEPLRIYDYYLLKQSELVSETEFNEWDTHNQKIERDIAARKKEAEERIMLTDLKKKYES